MRRLVRSSRRKQRPSQRERQCKYRMLELDHLEHSTDTIRRHDRKKQISHRGTESLRKENKYQHISQSTRFISEVSSFQL
jgi:hypothetical protein